MLVLAAALLYRRLAMAPLGWVFQIGAALIGYRLIVDPGLIWLLDDGALASAILSCLGPLLAFLAVVRVTPRAANPLMRATADSGALNTGALMAMVVLARWAGESIFSHWGFGLMAAIWVGSCLGQVYRRRESKGAARHLRTVFAWLAGASALLNIGLMIFGLALLLEPMAYFGGGIVSGPPLFDSLALALTRAPAVGEVGHDDRAHEDGAEQDAGEEGAHPRLPTIRNAMTTMNKAQPRARPKRTSSIIYPSPLRL